VTEASRQLKLLARDLECPVIALSQLNRNSESRMDKRPALSDLRESGAIEQDADLVVLLHRDMEPRPEQVNEFDMLVAKNRHGQTRALSMDWHGEFMSVLDR
ncbi:MAG TPA: DnaB-like helicase C-terminal domain-containing protein, partial [Nitrospira sp.]|nr:DnaB-like helicase C-terminal domain-containing protein [Nitrospira sp.]